MIGTLEAIDEDLSADMELSKYQKTFYQNYNNQKFQLQMIDIIS